MRKHTLGASCGLKKEKREVDSARLDPFSLKSVRISLVIYNHRLSSEGCSKWKQ